MKGNKITGTLPLLVKTPAGFSPDKVIDVTKGLNGKDGINGINGKDGINGKEIVKVVKGVDDRYRIYGNNRIDTAIELAGRNFKQADTVVIADSRNYLDALTGGVLAYNLNAPILITDFNLNPAVNREINRLKAKNIYIVGGDNSVSKNLENRLSKRFKITRIAGNDRFKTAQKVADKVYSIVGKTQSAIIADGTNYPDALTSSMISAKKKAPILLTLPNKLPDSVERYLKSEKINDITVVGGEKSVSNNVYNALEGKKNRIAGSNRYETSVLLAKEAYNTTKTKYIASGENYADALCTSPIAAKSSSPIILSERFSLPESVKKYVDEENSDNIYVVGGINSISPVVYYELMDKTVGNVK